MEARSGTKMDANGDLLDSSVRGLFHEMVPDASLGGDAFDGPVWRVLHCRTSTMGFHFGTTARFLWAIPLQSRAIPPTILLIALSDYTPLSNDPLFHYVMYVEPLCPNQSSSIFNPL